MLNNRMLIPVIIIPLVVALIVGLFFVFRADEPKDPVQTDPPIDTTEPSGDTIVIEPDYRFEHTIGDPVVDFDEGNEVFLDMSLLSYLERMEFGTPAVDEDGNYYFDVDGDIEYNADEEKHVEGVLDNLITLINHFAKEEYSMEASHQIQRFYVTYYDRFLETKYEDLVANIAECFPKEGADPETLPETMLEVFGFSRGDEFAFVFSPIEVAPIKVEFYNVRPSDIVLTEAEESLCIYENWHNPEDDGYERNLEGWLHNVIHVVSEKGYNDETVTLAQILFAGSLADAEYCSDWDDALIRCFSIEDMNYDNFKLSVEREFGVCVDYNVPLMDYFAAVGSEVGA